MSTFETGAVFKLENLVSPVLAKISGEFLELEKLIKRVAISFDAIKIPPGAVTALGRLTKGFADLDKAAASSGDAMLTFGGKFGDLEKASSSAITGISAGFGRLDESVQASIGRIGALKAEIESINMPRIGGPGSGGGGMGPRARRGDHSGGGKGGGFSFHPHSSADIGPGRVSARGAPGAALAGAFMVGDAIYEASKLEDIVAKIMITSQKTPTSDPLGTPEGKRIAAVIQKGMVATGFSATQIGEGLLGTEREFGGLTFEKKMDTLDIMMPAMAAEARLRDESFAEASKKIISMVHMAGAFDPKDLPEVARAFQFTTMNTPVGLGQFQNALSYSMPTLHAMGMDPSTIMLLTSMMQTSGVTNSKSGTWLRSFFQQAEPSTDVLGPLTKQQVQHNAALHMLGITDDNGKQNWRVTGADGKTDWTESVIKLSKELHDGMAAIPEGQRSDVIHRAFGAQGGGMATLLEGKSFVEQLPIIAEKMKQYKGGGFVMDEYTNASAVQQARVAIQDFQNIMLDLGKTALPTVNVVLKDLDDILKKLPGDWEDTKKMWKDRIDNLNPFKSGPHESTGRAHGRASGSDTYNDGGTLGLFAPISYTTGGVSGDENTIYRGVLHAFTDFASGVKFNGDAMGGSSSGFINASYETGGIGTGGGSSGGFVGSFGKPGWWTADRQSHAVDALMKGGLNEAGAKALVSRWMNVESAGGPDAVNPKSGAAGIAQWLGSRKNGMGSSFDEQLAHVSHELNTTEWLAKRRLNGSDPASGASTFERAEGYNGRTGVDNFTNRTRAGMARVHHGGATVAPQDQHIHVHLDGKEITASVVKRITTAMRFPTTMGGVDGHSHFSNASGTPVQDSA